MKTTTPLHSILAVLLAWLCLVVPTSTKAQCTSCTTTINVTTNSNANVTIPDDNSTVCLTGVNTTISPFTGTLNITGENVTICISPNVFITSAAVLNLTGNNGTIRNAGVLERTFFTLGNGYTLINTGFLQITNNLTINTGTFTNTGTALILGSYIQTDPAQVSIAGPTNISGSMNVDGGDLTITSIILTVGGGYTQNGGRVSGGNNPLLPGGGCGSINVTGTSNLSNGIFGFSGLIGMCDNQSSATGFDIANIPPATVTPGGSIKCDCFQALPVELLYFRGAYANNQVVLTWGTVSEKDNLFFTVERSANGIDFEGIAEVKGKGDSHSLHTYQSLDVTPYPGLTYYRLKQTDKGGSFTYSKVIVVATAQTANRLAVYPNPVNTTETVQIRAGHIGNETVQVSIYDQLGKKCFEGRYNGVPTIDIPVQLFTKSAGLYIVQARKGSEVVHEKVVVY